MNTPDAEDDGIYITGLGSISALGADPETVAKAYRTGHTRLRPREHGQQMTPVGALPDAAERQLGAFLAERSRYEDLDRSVHLALYAAHCATRRAGWTDGQTGGVVIGSSRGATGLWEKFHRDYLRNPDGKTAPLTSPTTTLGNISNWVAQELGASGPAGEISSTCSTSTYAIGTAMAWLRSGMARRFVAGGAEAPLTDFTIAQMRALRIYSRDKEAEHPCRPCAQDAGRRNTMVLGEGSCVLALERLDPDEVARREERARTDRSGQTPGVPLCRIVGAGFSIEPVQTNTSLSEEGDALRRSMRQALRRSRLEGVDVIVTHTPGTALGDRAELTAIRRLFGSRQPILTSNKWLLGHTLGASGALSIEYAAYILRTQDWVAYPYPVTFDNAPRQIRTVMVNSVGFGGNAGSLILTR